MKETMLVPVHDERFPVVYDEWIQNICFAIDQLHIGGASYIKQLAIYAAPYNYPNREWTVRHDLEYIIKHYRKSEKNTLLIGYATHYVSEFLLKAIVNKISSKQRSKDYTLTTITASKFTGALDYCLVQQYPTPDLQFVVVAFHRSEATDFIHVPK